MRTKLVNILLSPLYVLALGTFFGSALALGLLNAVASKLGGDAYVIAIPKKAE